MDARTGAGEGRKEGRYPARPGANVYPPTPATDTDTDLDLLLDRGLTAALATTEAVAEAPARLKSFLHDE